MEKGDFIKHPHRTVGVKDAIFISRLSIKHIVESRSKDGYAGEKIVRILLETFEVVHMPEMDRANTNTTHVGSRLGRYSWPINP